MVHVPKHSPTGKPRLSPELLDEERWAGLLGDAIDGLESFQVPTPHAGIEDVIGTVRYVRDCIAKQAAAKLRQLEDPF